MLASSVGALDQRGHAWRRGRFPATSTSRSRGNWKEDSGREALLEQDDKIGTDEDAKHVLPSRRAGPRDGRDLGRDTVESIAVSSHCSVSARIAKVSYLVDMNLFPQSSGISLPVPWSGRLLKWSCEIVHKALPRKRGGAADTARASSAALGRQWIRRQGRTTTAGPHPDAARRSRSAACGDIPGGT